MENEQIGRERRKNPRINYRTQLELQTGDSAYASQMINLSCAGVCCRVDVMVPLMTMFKIIFKLPGDDDEESIYVRCSGTVVRNEVVLSEDGDTQQCEIAIFFHEIERSERRKIENFIKRVEKTEKNRIGRLQEPISRKRD